MQEVKSALKTMAIWASVIVLCDLLRIAEMIWIPLPRGLVSTFYLPVLSIYLIHYFHTRIAQRDGLKFCLMCVAWMILIMVCLREIKYNAFDGQSTYCRYLWYLYYVPAILMPLCSFYAAIMINAKDKSRLPGRWSLLSAAAIMLILLVLTNDMHQQVFRFPDRFADWSTNYNHVWGFWIIWGWQYGLYFASIIAMIRRSGMTVYGKAVWVPLLPLGIGAILMIAGNMGYHVGFRDMRLLGFPEIMIFSIAFFWEGCIRIGLIPSNENYGKLMSELSLPTWITSEEGEIIYRSGTERKLPSELLKTDGEIRLDRNTVLHGRKIQGGYGLWTEDISQINETQDKLMELEEKLKEESVLMQLDNKRKEEQAHIDQQNEVYDRIADITGRQAAQIRLLARRAENAQNEAQKKECAGRICFYGAYMKRISNLMLLENADPTMNTGELFLAVSESLHYLEKTGVICVIGEHLDVPCPALQLVTAYVVFEKMIEANLDSLKGVFAAIQKNGSAIYLRLNLEGALHKPEAEILNYTVANQFSVYCEQEDDNLYTRIVLQRGEKRT